MMGRVAAAAVAALGVYAARRFYRNWGTTKGERDDALPGDDLIPDPAVQTTEAVWINASAAMVWSWLVQMGQDRGGLYSYQALEASIGLDVHDADRIHPEWQSLRIGDRVRLAPEGWLGLPGGVVLSVAALAPERYIVLRGSPPDMPWEAVWSFHIIPHWEDRSRLLVRGRQALRHPGEVVETELAGPVAALLTRGLLLGVKRRAEESESSNPARPAATDPAHQG